MFGLRHVTSAIFAGVLCCGGLAWSAEPPPTPAILGQLRSSDQEQILAALHSIEALQDDANALVTELVRIIQSDEYGTSDLAFRALQLMKARASPAVPILCEKLADERHWVRSSAVATLVSVGDQSVNPVRGLLSAKMGRVRAGATEVLGRLNRMSLDEARQMAADDDPRVRAAVARPLSQLGKPAVPLIVQLLSDPEPTVGTQAARGLWINQTDPSLAIPALTQALGTDCCEAAGKSLGAYGIAAQRSIPAILQVYATHRGSDACWFLDEPLHHIGPPAEADLEAVALVLKQPNRQVAALAADKLAQLGARGRPALPALTSAWSSTLEEFLRVRQELQGKLSAHDIEDKVWTQWRLVERSVIAIWYITRDDRQYLETVQSIVLKSGRPFTPLEPPDVRSWEIPAPWRALAPDSAPRIREMLNHPDRNVRLSALRGVNQMEVNAAPFKQQLREIALGKDEELQKIAVWCLQNIQGVSLNAVDPKLPAGLATNSAPDGSELDVDRPTSVALDAVARMGPKAQPLLGKVQGLLMHEDYWIRLRAGRAIFMITKDPVPLRQQIEDAFANEVSPFDDVLGIDRFATFPDFSFAAVEALKVIADCGREGARYIPLILKALRESHFYAEQPVFDTLGAIGTPDAIAALEELSHSPDWTRRTSAIEALEKLNNRSATAKGKE